MKENKSRIGSYIVIAIGFIARLIYVLNTSVYERGHDVGYYTSLSDGQINIGHLGYIEYIAKFGHIPDFDPFEVFIFYHPPLHHIFGAIVLKVSTLLGASIDVAFKNVQFLVLFYSSVMMIFVYLILKIIVIEEKHIIIPLAIFCFHPSLVYMSASINNDMLATLFEIMCIYYSVKWIKCGYKRKDLLLSGLCIGLGMCAKMTVGMLAFPVGLIMLMKLIDSVKDKSLVKCIKDYSLFALVTIPTGMWWTVRNLILFNQTPGVPTGDETDLKYVGFTPLIEQFGIPSSLGLDYPFHSMKASYCSNSWLIMFRTAMFTEIWPDIGPMMLLFCQVVFVGSVILGLFCAALTLIINIVEIKKGDRYLGAFFLCGYVTFILSFIAFVIKYQFTCSSDFRYIAAILIYSSTSIAQAMFFLKKRKNSQ